MMVELELLQICKTTQGLFMANFDLNQVRYKTPIAKNFCRKLPIKQSIKKALKSPSLAQ